MKLTQFWAAGAVLAGSAASFVVDIDKSTATVSVSENHVTSTGLEIADDHTAFFAVCPQSSVMQQVSKSTLFEVHEVSDRSAVMVVPSVDAQMVEQNLLGCDLERLRYVAPLSPSAPPVRGPAPSGFKDAVVSAVDGDYLFEVLGRISGDLPIFGGETISTRYTLSDDIAIAETYLAEQLAEANLDDVFFQGFSVYGSHAQNIVGVKLGSVYPDEIVVVGAHHDSTSQSPSSLAPGAVDNGSGSATIVSLAKAFADFETERTVHFCLFSGEEQGLHGSQHYVDEAKRNGDDVVAALLMDMTSYSNKYYGVTLEGTSNRDIVTLVAAGEENANRYAPKLETRTTKFSYGSDHVSFQRAGIPAFLYIEMDDTNYHSYHTTTDEIAYCNYDQTVDIAKASAALLADVSSGSPFYLSS